MNSPFTPVGERLTQVLAPKCQLCGEGGHSAGACYNYTALLKIVTNLACKIPDATVETPYVYKKVI